jgi:hypothetical protein
MMRSPDQDPMYEVLGSKTFSQQLDSNLVHEIGGGQVLAELAAGQEVSRGQRWGS